MTTNTLVLAPCFAYETVVGTSAMSSASATTYYIGKMEPDYKPTYQGQEWNVDAATAYNARQPSALAISDGEYPPIKLRYALPNAQCLYRFFGTSSGTSSPQIIVAKDTGTKKSYTLHTEWKGGTVPIRTQWDGCFTTGLTLTAELGKPFMAEETINWWSFEDQDDCYALTTAPVFPESIGTVYQDFTFTYGGNAKTYITRVDVAMEQEMSIVAQNATAREVYPGVFKPHALTVMGVIDDAALWDDWKHNTITTDAVLKVMKPGDSTKYIQLNFTNIAWKSSKLVPLRGPYAGFFVCYYAGVPQTIDVPFVHEGSNFATHYP